MMKLLTLLGLILLISCGKDDAGAENPLSGGTGGLDSVTPEGITISASRRYAPSQFNSYHEVAGREGDFLVPLSIDVVSGNSGVGWLQLRVGERKFCYKGNASSPKTTDGTQFLAAWEKTDLNEPCSSDNFKTEFDPEVRILATDMIKLTVDGGGCSKGHSACLFTEVVVSLMVRED